MERRNFIADFVQLNKGTEIPEMFALWCGLAGISAALSRRAFLDMGSYKVYPNTFIVLVAQSGRYRKSTAIKMIERLLRQMQPPPNIIAQKMTPEALIDAVRVTETSDGKNFLKQTCEGVAVADELATFLNKASYEQGLASLLIQLYDCVEVFEYHTKGRGKEKLTDTCLSILAGSTVDWIRSGIPEEAVGGGLTSRMMFVHVEHPGEPQAITDFTDTQKFLVTQCIQTLQHMSTLNGIFTMTAGARKYFIDEYNKFYRGSDFYDSKTLGGYASRRHIHLLKLAMLFSVSESDAMVLSQNHLEGSMALILDTEAHLKNVMNLITSSDTGATATMVLQLIKRQKIITRSRLLATLSHRINSRELSDIIDTLYHSRRIEIRGSTGNEAVYHYVEDVTTRPEKPSPPNPSPQ